MDSVMAEQELRSWCRGISPLPARLESWQVETLSDGHALARLVEEFGSPINLINPDPLAGNAAALLAAAEQQGVVARVFFARKANKSLGLVDAALAGGHGIDVASEGELSQVLARGAAAGDVILTAAVKPHRLLGLAVRAGVVISIDNLDEWRSLLALAADSGIVARVALRCAPEQDGIAPSRFGLTGAEIRQLLSDSTAWRHAALVGFHFHLAGYDHRQRALLLDHVLDLADEAAVRGFKLDFIDIGGGVPMRYLDTKEPWEEFWRAHHRVIRSEQPSMLWADDSLGLRCEGGEVSGSASVYPMWQQPVGAEWLGALLATTGRHGETLAARLRASAIALQLEPGRSLLDGCGLTVARVEARKRSADGNWYIALAMNRTQCRSAAADFLLDPLLIPAAGAERTAPIEGYLVGAYCIEAELLTLRRMSFPQGVAVGDLVVFVNTAGYMMHILESASHQIPLARNLVPTRQGWALDPIDQGVDVS